ncbi:MAG: YerC/YecD family TrpR-related protein [Paracholeplasma sp.]|jgi:TrpR-related protein YerC/YecD|nr:YerC/YecD family TrpR-related protein [Paracholeplasma sp.]MDY3196108.1 YerC/YecD family TrpR-related protein [Paracholeplasma sp.]
MAYKSKFATKEIDKLFEAILTLESVEECYKLFEDLCTIKEIQDMSQRLLVAKLLNEGVSYQNISKETLASSATISRVAKSLSYGADGYKLVLERTTKTTK